MKNYYEDMGDGTIRIRLDSQKGEFWTIINASDFDKANSYSGKWSLMRSRGSLMYVKGVVRTSREPYCAYRKILLHRFLVDAPPVLVVDHINHDTLDNRRENLRVVTQAMNLQNVRAHRDSLSGGIRGVSYSRRTGKWIVQVCVNYKHYSGGSYSTREEAEEAAIKLRASLMPGSLGK